MMILREDQLRDKIGQVTEDVSRELQQFKSTPPTTPKKFNSFDEDLNTSEFFKPYLVGSRFTSQEIFQKIVKAFHENKLDRVRFEFALAVLTTSSEYGYMERQSPNFVEWYNDSTNHH